MTGRHWPDEIKRRAKRMRFDGMSYGQIAAAIEAETGRPCCPTTVHRWAESLPVYWSAKARWASRWKRRALELYREGCSMDRAAAIIEIESGRGCNPVTVYRWIHPERAQEWTRRARANKRAA